MIKHQVTSIEGMIKYQDKEGMTKHQIIGKMIKHHTKMIIHQVDKRWKCIK